MTAKLAPRVELRRDVLAPTGWIAAVTRGRRVIAEAIGTTQTLALARLVELLAADDDE